MLVTRLEGRTFAVWTVVTFVLTLTCAFNLDSKPIYHVTMVSFLVALVYFILEVFVYNTVKIKNFLSPAIIATISFTWMTVAYKDFHKN